MARAISLRPMLTHLASSSIGSPAVHDSTTASKASPISGSSTSRSLRPPPALRTLVASISSGCDISRIPLATVFLEIPSTRDTRFTPPWGSEEARAPAFHRLWCSGSRSLAAFSLCSSTDISMALAPLGERYH